MCIEARTQLHEVMVAGCLERKEEGRSATRAISQVSNREKAAGPHARALPDDVVAVSWCGLPVC